MGGRAGHMMHLYDNPNLTFGQIRDIFNKASKGELIGTEKTDGQNLFVSYSVRGKEARAVRNKSEALRGGLDPEALAKKFSDRGDLTKTFVESFDAFERAVKSLPIEDQLELFGPDANNFYNAEIMNPSSANVINYDTKSLVIHRVGHEQRDKHTDKIEPLQNPELVKKLENALESMQDAQAEDDYGIQVNAMKNLGALTSDKPLDRALSRLSSFMEANRLDDKSTVGDYIVETLNSQIEKFLPDLNEETKQLLLGRMLGQKGVSITQVLSQIPKEAESTRSAIRELVEDGKFMIKTAIYPLEDIVHDFSVEMLRGLESAFILDNKKEVRRLKDEVALAIQVIEDSGNEEAMEILSRQMKKLKKVNKVSTATEGFVFDYDGNTYKFTGNFAPVNQILGLFKYGRGNVPPLRKVNEEEGDAELEVKKADIALLPGSFKPPHRGHLSLADRYSDLADKVVILISNPQSERSIRSLSSGDIIAPEMAKEIWEIYLENAGLNNVEVMISPSPSPVGAVYDYLDSLVANDQTADVIVGASTKGDDQKGRYEDIEKYQGTNVSVVSSPMEPLGVDDTVLSASDMRVAIDELDIDTLEKYFLPSGVSPEMIVSIIKSQNPDPLEGEELEEISAAPSVGGYAGNDRKKKRISGMIQREDIMFEIKLRELIRKRIIQSMNENKKEGMIFINKNQNRILDKYHSEYVLRKCIRQMILKEKTEPTPHSNTGINQLSDLLKKVVPILSVGYKSLTTDQAQRTSYRSHIINAVINSLAPAQAEANIDNPEAAEELEEVDINIEDETALADDKFIDIDPAPAAEEEEESFQTLAGQDLTGRNIALKDFDRIERIILDAYDVLGDQKDQDLFYDYLLTNLKLYFDKFESELSATEPEPTTDEYESEKAEEEELPQETPAELEGGEEELTLQEVESEKQRKWAHWQRGLKKGDKRKKLTNDEAEEFIASSAHK